MPHFSAYFLVLAAWLVFRLLASRRNSPIRGEFRGRVCAVVPTYNEDLDVLTACIESLAPQVDELWIVDDGSTTPIPSYLAYRSNTHLVRFAHNEGKRAALATVLAGASADVFVTVDSDTIAGLGAIEKLVSAFVDPRVNAATGLVRGLNRNANLLTKLIDLRYAATFLGERAAYSAFGSVLCCCGSLAAYRVSAVQQYAHDLETQTLLGRKVAGGDDRRMTNYALQTGRAVLIEDARAQTLVPERPLHFVKQQVRWSRSFLRETLWAMWHLRGRSRVLAVTEFVMQVGLTVAILVALATMSFGPAIAFYLFWCGAAALARMSPALRDHEISSPLWLAPVYGLLHLALLIPRLFAFATVRNGSWGTRQKVEVSG